MKKGGARPCQRAPREVRTGQAAGSAFRQPLGSAKRAPKLFRIRPEIFDVDPDLGLKLGQTKPEISGALPTNRHTAIPNDSGPSSGNLPEAFSREGKRFLERSNLGGWQTSRNGSTVRRVVGWASAILRARRVGTLRWLRAGPGGCRRVVLFRVLFFGPPPKGALRQMAQGFPYGRRNKQPWGLHRPSTPPSL